MLFHELRFLAFFLLVFGVHWLLPAAGRARKAWLLLASYAFYAGWDPRFLSLIWISTAVDYFVGRRLAVVEEPRARRRLLWLSLGANLGLLGFFKYFGFFVESGARFLSWLGLDASPPTLAIVLPVGISFYTFQTLSYTIDVYRRNLEPIDRPLDFALFVAFFPQLVAGPIVRASEFLPQLLRPRRLREVRFRPLLLLFLLGWIKKACVADRFGEIADRLFQDPGAYTTASHWLGLLAYAVQIYCDFSGYSDMAIATGGLLGYRLPLNFAHPYLASTVTEFWRRWHISLSTWFRDYLYIPLGGSRTGTARTARNLVLVFFLCGLWHGAAWTFVVWGLFHGFFLSLERVFLPRRRLGGGGPILRLYTLLVAVLAWVFFRAGDFATAETVFAGLFGRAGGSGAAAGPLAWAVLLGFFLCHAAFGASRLQERLARLPAPLFALGYGAAWAFALPFAAARYQPFIYFQF